MLAGSALNSGSSDGPRQIAVPALKNRGRISMVADVLRTCQRGAYKSHLMLRANLNSVVTGYLLSQLMSRSLLGESEEEGRPFYQTTPLGRDFLKRYDELSSMLSDAFLPAAIGEDRR